MVSTACAAVLALSACATPKTPGGAPAGAAAAAASGTAAPGAAATSPGAPRQVTSIEGITEYALANGMHVLLFPDASKDTVTVNVTYLVGSRHEGYGETGMAHLLEHMMFKGSPRHPKVWEELKQRGASNNASTWYDRTNYFETLPAAGDGLSWALEMEADRMVNSNIAQKDLSAEFSVVRNEFELGENDPGEILSERMWSTAYLWHNYGKSTIGSRADIERVPAPRLKAFYKKYYRPDNAILVVAGKFDPARALETIGKSFGAIPRPAVALPPTYTVEPAQDGEREVTLRRTGDVQMVGLVYHGPAGSDEQFAATQAIADILTSEPSGRLYKALVKTGMAAEVSAQTLSLHDPGVLELNAKVRADKSAERVRDKMISIVEGLATSKVTDEEVARFRAKYRRAFKLSFTNSQRVATQLSEAMATGDWRLLFLQRDQVDQLTADKVRKVAATYLMSSNRTLGMFLPTKQPARAPLVEAPDVVALLRDYKGGKAVSEGEAFEATVANIEKRTVRATLKSGLKVALLAKETRGDVVHARLTVRYGTEKDLTGKRVAADFLGDLMRRGTRKHDFQQLKDEWDRLEAQVVFNSEPGELTVDIATTHDSLPEVLALVDEVLRTPSFPGDQFAVAVKERLAQIEEQSARPESQSFNAFQRAVAPYPVNHPSYVPTFAEQIAGTKALTLAQVKRLHGWLGMSNATFTIVGDFDPAAVRPWLESGWGSWKSTHPFERIAAHYVQTKPGELFVDTPDKENALIVMGYAVPMRDDNPDYPTMTAANYVLGGGGFVSRLLTRLRQKDGLSYGAFSFYQASALDEWAVLGAGAILAPQNAAKGMTAALEEFDRLTSQGVPADELTAAKQGMAKDWSRSLADDGFVLGRLHDGLFVGRTMDFYGKQEDAVQALEPDQVNAVIKKYFKRADIYRVTGGDKKKAGG
ncbi:MAG TPA: pitrilysin family protein [Kofleriaceae bacterium]|nr:pitrilysin family protein [Kofleriaceae bacterium]